MRVRIVKAAISSLLIGSMLMINSNLAYASAGQSDLSTSTGTSDSKSESGGSSSKEVTAVITEAENTVNATVSGVGKSTVSGMYTAKNVSGTAITESIADVSQNLGLGKNEKAYVTTWDITAKKSPAAYASLLIGANSIGAEMGPMIQVNLNKMSSGKLVSLDGNSGKVKMAFGIPTSFKGKNTYAIVHVAPGGKFEILKDLDNNPNTITVSISAGNGAYAIVAY